jgi:hypothetical protein
MIDCRCDGCEEAQLNLCSESIALVEDLKTIRANGDSKAVNSAEYVVIENNCILE